MGKENKNVSINFSVGLWNVVFVVFLLMKVMGVGAVATWSWWWVLSPLWIPLAISAAVFAVWILITAIILIVSCFL